MSARPPSPNRRAVLLAGAGAAVSPATLAQGTPPAGFGSPVVELCVPGGLLSLEQKAAMVKGMTDVVLKALDRTPDPARRCFVAIIEAAEGGFGADGKVFTPKR